jgi:hypothetical protein
MLRSVHSFDRTPRELLISVMPYHRDQGRNHVGSVRLQRIAEVLSGVSV